MSEYDVFISHASKDIKFANKISDDLKRYGITCWIDEAEMEVGESIIDEISDKIQNSQFFVAIISKNVGESKWVNKELSMAMTNEISCGYTKVFPLIIDNCSIPSTIIDKACLDFTDSSNYHTELSKLIEKIIFNKENHKPIKTRNIKVVSFDLDGSLCSDGLDEYLWRFLIPKLYAEKMNIEHSVAYLEVIQLYAELWGEVGGKWRNPDFWLQKLGLNVKLEDLLSSLSPMFFAYHDTYPIIEELSKNYQVILTTTASRNLMEYKLKKANLTHLFSKTFSISTDFDQMTKSTDVYVRICSELGVNSSEIIHCGDDELSDVIIPSEIGIKAFLLDRRGLKKNKEAISNLFELKDRLSMINR